MKNKNNIKFNIKEGEGILDTLTNIKNKTVSKIKQIKNETNKYVKAVVGGRNDYPPKVRNILNKDGDQTIIGITIGRTPVPSVLTSALNVASGGTFSKMLKEAPYDELYHLFIRLNLENGDTVSLEKNEVINMDIDPPLPTNTTTQIVNNIPQDLTVNILLQNTKQRMGGKFFSYSARDNNCQDFIKAIFESNNIGNQQNIEFIKQDTKQLFSNNTTLRKISNTITDLGATVNTITQGAGLSENIIKHFDKDNKEMLELNKAYKNHLKIEKSTGGSLNQKHLKYYEKYKESENDYDNDSIVQSVIFDKNKYNIPDCKKWLKKHNYKIYKVDETENTYRWRQFKPENVEKNNFNIYKNKKLGNSGIILVIAYKKKNIKSNSNYIMPRRTKKIVLSDTDSDSDSECEGLGLSGSYQNDVVNVSKMRTDSGKGLYAGVPGGQGLYAGKGLYAGAGFIHHIHHHHIVEGGKINFKKIGHTISNAFHPTTNEKVAAHYLIPAATGAIGSTLGGPVGGLAGAYLGSQLNKAVGVQNDTTFKGTGRHPHRVKGSQAAKDHMSKIRAMKKK